MEKFYQTRMLELPWMHRCPNCGMCMVSPIPAALDDDYDDAYTAGAAADRKNRRLAPDYLRKIAPHLPGGRWRFLEAGGSHGWLAEAVRDRFGADVLVLEPGKSAVAAAVARGLNARVGYLENFGPEKPFNVVCAAHVVEHVQRIDSFLEACGRVLQPGGKLILITPNAGAWKLARFGATWAWAVPEQHTHFLSPASARGLLRRHGFDRIQVIALTPGFAHYPFFVARKLADFRSAWPAAVSTTVGILTRLVALAEYLLLRVFDSCFHRNAADELLIVASKVE
jgi:SAM-dependent methyltransferase